MLIVFCLFFSEIFFCREGGRPAPKKSSFFLRPPFYGITARLSKKLQFFIYNSELSTGYFFFSCLVCVYFVSILGLVYVNFVSSH